MRYLGEDTTISGKGQLAGAAQADDLDAHLAFKNDPSIEVRSSAAHWISVLLKPDLVVLDTVVAFFRRSLSRLPSELCENLALVLYELLENAFEHGCGFDPAKRVELTYIRTDRMIMFEIRDPGLGFSLRNIDHAALSNPPGLPLQHVEYRFDRGMRPGGYGIVLAKRIADELIYNEMGNEVVVIKNL